MAWAIEFVIVLLLVCVCARVFAHVYAYGYAYGYARAYESEYAYMYAQRNPINTQLRHALRNRTLVVVKECRITVLVRFIRSASSWFELIIGDHPFPIAVLCVP